MRVDETPEAAGLLAREGVSELVALVRKRRLAGMDHLAAIVSVAEDLHAATVAAEQGVHDEALAVACPYCHAAPGDQCRYRRGWSNGCRLPALRHHGSRLSAAMAGPLGGRP